MNMVSSFIELLNQFSPIMTAPTFQSYLIIITGWLFAQRRTITGMIVAADAVNVKHHSAFHRIFARAPWSMDDMGLTLFRMIEPFLSPTVMLAVDDTLARKRGLKIFGVGMHHDPLLSTRKMASVNWGHSWVIVAVLVKFSFCKKRTFALPILFRLYLNKQAAVKEKCAYRTRPELAIEMLKLLCLTHENKHFHVVADTEYGGQSVLLNLPSNCDLTSRLQLNARLYDAPPAHQTGVRGRPRKRGNRLPSPREMLQMKRGRCITLDVYGRHDKVRIRDTEARVHAAPKRPLRVVAIDMITGNKYQHALYSTVHDASAKEVLEWYAMRWSIEVTFHDTKQQLGFEQPQGWSRRAVERTAPMAMLLYSLIVLWFAKVGHRSYRAPNRPWYPQKCRASFADMLITLRQESIRERFSSMAGRGRGYQKILKTLLITIQQAA